MFNQDQKISLILQKKKEQQKISKKIKPIEFLSLLSIDFIFFSFIVHWYSIPITFHSDVKALHWLYSLSVVEIIPSWDFSFFRPEWKRFQNTTDKVLLPKDEKFG